MSTCQVFSDSLGPFTAYEPVTVKWNACPTTSTSTVDMYLNVEESSGLVPVHVWTGITFKSGELDTQLKAAWWNASNGQPEDVQARFIMVQSGGQVWASTFPASNAFTVSFNGTLPSSSIDVAAAAYTGPSVESVAGSKPKVSGSTLGIAIVIPLLVVALAVASYVLWQKKKRAPEKKRWSAVIDNRLSMISAGTAPPPRFSVYSHHSGQHSGHSRPSMSQSTRSHATSMYSAMQSPMPGSTPNLASSPRLSFAEAPRPSFERRQSGLRNSESAAPPQTAVRHSVAGMLPDNHAFTDSDEKRGAHGHSWSTSALPRSKSTQEHLASPRQRNNPSKLRNEANRISAASMGGALENMTAVKIVRDPTLAYDLSKSASSHGSSSIDEKGDLEADDSPFADPIEAEPEQVSEMQERYSAAIVPLHMPAASTVSPDDMLRRYAAATTTAVAVPTSPQQATSRKSRLRGMIRSLSRTMSPTRSSTALTASTPPMSPTSLYDKELPHPPSSFSLAQLAEEEERELQRQRQKKALSAMSFAASPPADGRRASRYEEEDDDVMSEKAIDGDANEQSFGKAM